MSLVGLKFTSQDHVHHFIIILANHLMYDNQNHNAFSGLARSGNVSNGCASGNLFQHFVTASDEAFYFKIRNVKINECLTDADLLLPENNSHCKFTQQCISNIVQNIFIQ